MSSLAALVFLVGAVVVLALLLWLTTRGDRDGSPGRTPFDPPPPG